MQSLPKNQSGKKKSALIHNIQGEQLQNVGLNFFLYINNKF